jgi:hypothetical protein
MIGDGVDEFPSPGRRGGLTKHVRLRTATKIAAIPVIVALLMLSSSSGPEPLIPPEELASVEPPGADSAAREVAREFAVAITAGDWAAAARLVTPRTNRWDLTSGLRRFVGNQSLTVTSEPDPRDFGYAVELAQEGAEARRWLLSLSLTQEQGQPRVYAYQLALL